MTDLERLFLQASKENNLKALERYIKKGVNVNIKDKRNGNTALINNSCYGNLEIAKLLIDNGATIDIQNEDKETALIQSVFYNNLNMVKYLVENGADVNIQNDVDDTALLYAAYKGYLDIVKYLLNNGANIDYADSENETALINSSFCGYFNIVKLLISYGADVNVKNNNGDTALTLSCHEENFEITNYLIPYVYEYEQFELIYTILKIKQKHILFKHFMNNRDLLEQVNPRKMKGFIKEINEYKNNLK